MSVNFLLYGDTINKCNVRTSSTHLHAYIPYRPLQLNLVSQAQPTHEISNVLFFKLTY